MATAYVTYEGDPGKDKRHQRYVQGMEPWSVGETRAFTDEFAQSFGFKKGDEFALFFTTVDNANMKVPRWSLSKTDPSKPEPKPADKPSPAPASKE